MERVPSTQVDQSASTHEQQGLNSQRPPAFQLQAAPIVQMQNRPQGEQQGANAAEAQGAETESGESGRVGLTQNNADSNAPIAPEWEAFALAFSERFNPILSSFDTNIRNQDLNPEIEHRRRRLGLPARPSRPNARRQSADEALAAATDSTQTSAPASTYTGPRLSAQMMRDLFSDFHRTELMNFCSTGIIPDRLFSGGDVGRLSVAQRVLISSVILATGRHRRGAFDQRVHGHNCGHWVGLVNQYAGIGPQLGQRGGFMASFDHNGNIMTNSGTLNEVFAGRLHNASEGTSEAEIPADTDQARAMTAEQTRNGGGRTRFGRHEGLPAERFDEIQPGDWLWVYNANSSNTGDHSLIFVRWMSGTQPNEPAANEHPQRLYYRTALCYSQPSVDRGGVQHISNLGNMYDRERHVAAITRVRRSTDTNTTIQPEDLIPRLNRGERNVLTGANRDFIRRLERGGNHFDVPRLLDWIRTQNTERLGHIANRLSPQQQAVYRTANQGAVLEQMVMLYQRLKQLNENSDLLAATIQENATTRGLDRRHETYVTNRATLNQEIESITAQLADTTLTRTQRRRLAARRDLLRTQMADLDIHEPYSMSHPGNLPQRSQVVVDGQVEHAFTREELAPYIVAAPAANP